MARIDFTECAQGSAQMTAEHTIQGAKGNQATVLAQLIESIAGAHVSVSPQMINGDLAGYASQLRAQMCTIYRLAAMLGETLTAQGV